MIPRTLRLGNSITLSVFSLIYGYINKNGGPQLK
jgi:hypothetical protein